MGYPSEDKDWVVIGETPESMLAQGFVPVGKDFPVFLHPENKEEYALARQERKTKPGYTGFAFDASASVTLEQDLLRRDLTLNAIAQDREGKLIDPYHGEKDIRDKILRHVSPAFCEDPVRVLRVARFAARYHHLGFRIAPETMTLMRNISATGEIDHLVSERVWKEFEKALGERSPQIFIQTLHECHALKIIMPELDILFGIPQPEAHHPEIDTGIHSLLSLEQACLLSNNRATRFASVMHDLGKALTDPALWPKHHGHESLGLNALDALCERLKVPSEFRDLARITMEFHTHSHRARELKAKTILSLLKRIDVFRKPQRFEQFLLCCEADAKGRTGLEETDYPQASYLREAWREIEGITAKQFVKAGLKGKAIGEAIDRERSSRLTEYVKQTRADAANENT